MAPMKLPVASCVVTLVLLKFILNLDIIVHSTLIVSLHTIVSLGVSPLIIYSTRSTISSSHVICLSTYLAVVLLVPRARRRIWMPQVPSVLRETLLPTAHYSNSFYADNQRCVKFILK